MKEAESLVVECGVIAAVLIACALIGGIARLVKWAIGW